jgi:hypothetical protein
VHVRMSNRLAGSLADINPDVIAVRRATRFDVTPNCRKKSPDGGLLFTTKGEEITRVSPRNNQAMSLIQRKGVGKGHGQAVRGNEPSASEPVTEDTVQFSRSDRIRADGSFL